MSDEPSEVERYRPEGEYAQRHYAAIGKVAAEWAEFEFILDTRTLRLAGFPAEKGTCLTAQIAGPARKLDAYISLARLCGASETTIKKISKFQQQTYDLAEKRNRIVHDQWLIFPSGSTHRLEITARRKLVINFIEHTTEAVDISNSPLSGSNILRSERTMFLEPRADRAVAQRQSRG